MIPNKTWISPTKLLAFIINNKQFNKQFNCKFNCNKNFTENGYIFENKIITQIKSNYKNCYVSAKNIDTTISNMKYGIPIIFNSVVYNTKNKTFGNPDILIRSDYINSLTHIPSYINLYNDYSFHYKVIDIKAVRLNFNFNNLIKDDCWSIYYKIQLYIYNEAISEMQGYKSNQTYILGYDDPFYKLGIIDYNIESINYNKLINDAIIAYKKI